MTPSFLMRAAEADSQGEAVGASSLLRALRQTCNSKGFGEAREGVTPWGPFQTSCPILQPISRGGCLRRKICILSAVQHSYTHSFEKLFAFVRCQWPLQWNCCSTGSQTRAKDGWLCQGYADLHLSPSAYQASLNIATSKQQPAMPSA